MCGLSALLCVCIQKKRQKRFSKMIKCKKCGGPIKFNLLDSGKYCPISVNGGDHWDKGSEKQPHRTSMDYWTWY
jgi:hypothetical protein